MKAGSGGVLGALFEGAPKMHGAGGRAVRAFSITHVEPF